MNSATKKEGKARMKLKTIKDSKKGQINMIGTVVAVIIAVVAVAIGIIISSELIGAFDTDLEDDADFSGSWNSTKDMTSAGFNVLPVVIIITASVAVIGAVLVLGGR